MYPFLKRIFDIVSAFFVLVLLAPIMIVIAIVIVLDSKGGVFYKQERIGKDQIPFGLFKFRSMKSNADKTGQITIGADARITKVGRFIRKYKIDELPQLINIIKGDMSVVGPRPEVAKYVQLYNKEQLNVLSVRPGLTDFASLEFINEQEILGKAEDPDKTYIEIIMPAKLALNKKYLEERSLGTDFKIIFQTIFKIFK
ncbi:sugar transferase [Putridiphycobacter roseus]|uniref:Sugar transferase n=1 Tax=Putridiphycobacter roseus TaxID=2219161 RepID=A0A2W1NEH5_9FLAO|nr:sugar transferase [Putridiphycobacter roseus]PZE16466.1 sugar transferase [Putridiphycobacter roseus]